MPNAESPNQYHKPIHLILPTEIGKCGEENCQTDEICVSIDSYKLRPRVSAGTVHGQLAD